MMDMKAGGFSCYLRVAVPGYISTKCDLSTHSNLFSGYAG